MESPKDPLPDWAVAHARASLALGHLVPDIEEWLIAKGLFPETANAVVMSVVEGNVRQTFQDGAATEPSQPLHLLLSAGLVSASLLLAYLYGSGLSVGRTCIWVLPGLGLLWIYPSSAPVYRFFGYSLLIVILSYRVFLWSIKP